MSASSRTATAEGRKKTTIASTHRSRLASPNWLAAVVSHRSPTIAVMLKDRKSTRLNSSHITISYAVFCLKKKTEWQLSIDSRREAHQKRPVDEHRHRRWVP